MGYDKLTGQRTPATAEEDAAADAERAADRWHLEDVRRMREERPHYELRATCRSCGTDLVIEVAQPLCNDCK